ncbi:MAG: metal-dependent hydrolase [Nitrososphaeria archaeon]
MTKRIPHIFLGVGLAVFFIGSKDPLELTTIVCSALFASILPDLDVGTAHRLLLHNIFVPFLTASALCLTTLVTIMPLALKVTASYLASYFSHILLDLLTGGVTLFYPMSSETFYILKRRYDDLDINSMAAAVGLILIYVKISLR